MRIGGSMCLIALGAILTFAIHVQTRGFSLHTIGIILMLVGAVAAAFTLIAWNRRSKTVTRRNPSGQIVEQRFIGADDPATLVNQQAPQNPPLAANETGIDSPNPYPRPNA